MQARERQQVYYAETAKSYDAAHLHEPEHEIALAQMEGLVRFHGFESLLDVGSGTGRVLRRFQALQSTMQLAGIEPVEALREVAYSHGIPRDMLVAGDACELNYPENSVDIVCAFGVLHHIREPNKAVAEMCRVAKKAIFLSDLNNYGCGSLAQRVLAQTLRTLGLWKSFQWIKNGGRLEKYSEGDGVHYSYSLRDSVDVIRSKFSQIHFMNTKGSHFDLYRRCSHWSVFGTRATSANGQSG